MLAQVGCIGYSASERRYHFRVFFPSIIVPWSKSQVLMSNQTGSESTCRSLVTHAVTTTLPFLLHARSVAFRRSSIDGEGELGAGEGVVIEISVDGRGVVGLSVGAQPRLLSNSTTVQDVILRVRWHLTNRRHTFSGPVGSISKEIGFTHH